MYKFLNDYSYLRDVVVFDLETTGFDYSKDRIIEIGALRYMDGVSVDRFSVFVNPHCTVPLEIKQLTKITEEQLQSGLETGDALRQLSSFIGNRLLICHNSSFDVNFLNTQLMLNNMPPCDNQVLDTLELGQVYFPFLLNHKLNTLSAFFEQDLRNYHRAICDAEATGNIFFLMLRFILDVFPLDINFQVLETSVEVYNNSAFERLIKDIVNYQRKYSLINDSSYPLLEDETVKKIYEKYELLAKKSNYMVSTKQDSNLTVNKIFEEGGVLEQHFADYEVRAGQIEMSELVLNSLEKSKYLLVEAGTGVGKSLAYLIPAIIFSAQNLQKVIISTNTKNLQEQLFFKDLPTIKECLDLPFAAALLKGRDNYICERKWIEVISEPEVKLNIFERKLFIKLIVWKFFTKTGDISENNSFLKSDSNFVWKKVAADRHFCRGRKCTYFEDCYLMRIRNRSEKSNLIVINHSLFLADYLNNNSIISKAKYFVLDEAHNIPEIASKHFSITLSNNDFNYFFNQLFTIKKSYQFGLLITLKINTAKSMITQEDKELITKKTDSLIELIEEKKGQVSELFSEVTEIVKIKGDYGKFRIKNTTQFKTIYNGLKDILDFWKNMMNHLNAINIYLLDVKGDLFSDYEQLIDSFSSILKFAKDFQGSLETLTEPDLENFALWLSASSRKADFRQEFHSGIINYAPLEVDEIFSRNFYGKINSIIFTSATIAIRSSFKYFVNRMGLNLNPPQIEDENHLNVGEIIIPSPFDYEKQSLVICTDFLPNPADGFFIPQSIDVIKKTVRIANLGCMILFTSYKDLNAVYDSIALDFYKDNILLLAQGKGAGRSAILSEFKGHGKGVLLGTNSFWEGVDVKGDSLSLLVLFKLPFQVPSEPIVEAYIEKLNRSGKNSFMYYTLPNALLRFKQGFGRLIRGKNDRGIILILDNRIKKKFYGEYFEKSVPAKILKAKNPEDFFYAVREWYKKDQS